MKYTLSKFTFHNQADILFAEGFITSAKVKFTRYFFSTLSICELIN